MGHVVMCEQIHKMQHAGYSRSTQFGRSNQKDPHILFLRSIIKVFFPCLANAFRPHLDLVTGPVLVDRKRDTEDGS